MPLTSPPDAGTASRRPVGWVRHRLGPLLVAAGLSALAFAQRPGLLLADTKLDLVVDPAGFLDRITDLWDPTASFGQIPNQAVGYWFPMGPFFWLGDRLGLAPWVIQRLWIAALLVVAFWGMLRVLEALGVGRPGGRIVGALVFAFSPILLAQVAYRSGSVLPTVLVPLALVPLITGAREGSPRRAAARSAVAVAFMGGVNGAATFLVLAVPVLYLLTREPGPRRRGLTLWWGGLVVAATLWWIGPLLLQQRYGLDFLSVTEQAAATTQANSLGQILRGTAYWELDLQVGGQPWLPAGVRFGSQAVTVLGTAVIAVFGVVGLALTGLRERRYLVLLLAGGVAAMAAGYAGPVGGPLSGPVQDLLDGPLAPARNLHKMAPLVALPLAVGVAHALDRWATRREARIVTPAPRGAGLRPVGAFVALVAILAAASAPLVLGELAPSGAFEEVPDYWQDAIGYINEEGRGRTLLLPGTPWAEYEWGRPLDEPLQPLSDDAWAVRNIVPLGGLRVTRFMDGIEALLETGRGSPGLAAALRRSGTEWVLVRNDLDQERTSPPSPTQVRRVLEQSPGLTRVAAWGPPIVDPLDRRRLGPELVASSVLRSLELYRVDREVDPIRLDPADDLVVAAGAPESTLTLTESGLVDQEPVVLSQDVVEDLPAADRWVLTDDLRRRDVDFGRVHAAESYTLDDTEPAPDRSQDDPVEPVDRLPGVTEAELAVARYEGVDRVRASSYFTGYDRAPGRQPAAALDGSPETSWAPAAFLSPEDEWWEVQFDEPRDVPWLRVRLPDIPPGGGWIRELEVMTDTGTRTIGFTSPQANPTVRLPSGPTRRIRLTITDARLSYFDVSTPGIAEVTMGGVDVERTVVLPDLVPADAGAEVAAIALSRERADPFDPASGDEEAVIDRTVTLPDPLRLPVTGTASAVAGDELDALLAALDRDGLPAAEATSSWRGLPAFRPENAVDGDGATPWLADPTDRAPVLTVHLSRPERVTGVRVRKAPSPGRPIDTLRISTGAGTREVDVDDDGIASFPAVVTDHLDIGFPTDLTNRAAAETLVGVSELEVVSAEDPLRVVDTAARVRIPCGSGPDVVVNGRTVPTRVEGRTEDLLASRPLVFEGCGPASLDSGANRIRTEDRSGLRVDTLVFGAPTATAGDSERSLEVVAWGREHRTVRAGPGDEALLTVDENANAGWTATLNGTRLAPFTADGWRQGWVVPAGQGGEIELAFTPGQLYDRLLQLGLLVALSLVAALVVPGRTDSAPSGARRIPRPVVLTAGTVALVLAAGPWGLALPLFAHWLREDVLVRVAAAGMVTVAGLTVARELSWTGFIVGNIHPVPLTQIVATVALAAVFARAGRQDRATGAPTDPSP